MIIVKNMLQKMRQNSDFLMSDETKWKFLVKRKPPHEGAAIYAVRTTGIFCRFGCPSRLPKPENVRFFDTPAEAIHAGFRPCKRCKPERVKIC